MKKYSCGELLEMFESHLAQTDTPAEPELLYNPIVYSMSNGGKRLRPTLLLAAYNIFADDMSKALPAATAIEMFHNFTLLHDDIMDNAAVRRGRPSVFAKWGANVAILSGDAMLIVAYSHLQKCAKEVLPQIFDLFNTMALQVCEGQQYDMDFESRQKVSVVDYMNMIELKTSALLAGAVSIGAVLGGASEEDCRKLNRFALELGLAFQLQDDLLDSYGDESELGKKIGGDILEGKKTFLMMQAMSHADEPKREILRSTYKDATLTAEEKIARVKAVYDALDIRRITEQQISTRFERAISILDSLSVGRESVAEMREFALSLIGRTK
ncbi:MAG: polyprenyl synthetase family protein [Alistipes sp.]|nr:polyprenyl synthetase family protein [Alistipes sp.]MBQ7342533.1 polyprenyl synthetase family protein [Alistipes sp.]